MPNKERVEYLNQLASDFAQDYPKTAILIKQLAQILSQPNVTKEEISAELSKIMTAFEVDYVKDDEISAYRRKCFKIFFGKIMEIWEKKGYASLTKVINNTSPELEKAIQSLTALKEIYEATVGSSEKSRYFSVSFMYLILLEGLFDEVIWFIYSCYKTLEDKSVNYEILKKTSLNGFKSYLDPVFFEGYNNRVRNAIAHAGFSFEDSTKRMTFKDIGETESKGRPARQQPFEETLTLQEFGTRYFEKVFDLFRLRICIVLLLCVGEVAIREKPFGRVTMNP